MDTNTNQTFRALFCFCGALLLSIVGACSSHTPEIHTLGFLRSYEQLARGREGQANLIYIDEEADFSIYSAIVIEPVVAWPEPGGQPTAQTQELATNLDEDLRRELAHEFDLVDRPGAGALQLRAALASEAGSHVVLEVELLDGASGNRLIAAVDRRRLESDDWLSQTDTWAVLIRNRLASFRQFDSAWHAREAGTAP